MADFDIYLGEGDTAPILRRILLVPVDPDDPDADIYPNGKPADLTGATVTFKLRPADESTAFVLVPVDIESPATSGAVRVRWAGYTPGSYLGRFKGVMANGDKISFLNNRLLTVEVTADP